MTFVSSDGRLRDEKGRFTTGELNEPTVAPSTARDHQIQEAILEQLKALNETAKASTQTPGPQPSPKAPSSVPQDEPSRKTLGEMAAALKTIALANLGTELSIAAGVTLAVITIAQFTQPRGADTLVQRVMGTDFQAEIQVGDEIGGYPVTSGYGPREAPATNQGQGSSNHRGVDLGTPEGIKLYMIGDKGGTVTCDEQPEGAGLYATLTVPGVPYTFRAMHLRNCQPGEFKQGQVYAETGNTGNSSGPHLHWEQLKDGEHVHPQKGYLLATMVGNWDEVMNEVVPAKKGFGDVTDRLMSTILIQESGGDPDVQNVHTGAAGLYQILPENIPAWSQECMGKEVDLQTFLGSKDVQNEIAGCKLKQYWDKAKERGVDDHTACRMVASSWYSGDPDLYNSTAPQDGYPSIADYTESVCSRF